MREIELRISSGTRSPGDITVMVQDKTFDYLMSTISPEIRVSAYLDRDLARVELMYAELFVGPDCRFESKITKLIPGSKERDKVTLPGPMEEGEQLIVIVARKPIPASTAG